MLCVGGGVAYQFVLDLIVLATTPAKVCLCAYVSGIGTCDVIYDMVFLLAFYSRNRAEKGAPGEVCFNMLVVYNT